MTITQIQQQQDRQWRKEKAMKKRITEMSVDERIRRKQMIGPPGCGKPVPAPKWFSPVMGYPMKGKHRRKLKVEKAFLRTSRKVFGTDAEPRAGKAR